MKIFLFFYFYFFCFCFFTLFLFCLLLFCFSVSFPVSPSRIYCVWPELCGYFFDCWTWRFVMCVAVYEPSPIGHADTRISKLKVLYFFSRNSSLRLGEDSHRFFELFPFKICVYVRDQWASPFCCFDNFSTWFSYSPVHFLTLIIWWSNQALCFKYIYLSFGINCTRVIDSVPLCFKLGGYFSIGNFTPRGRSN